MKLFSKLLLTALVIALLLPFTLLKDESGNTLMSVSDLISGFSLTNVSLPGMPDLSDHLQSGSSGEDLEAKDIFYKWYDSEGYLQFTTEPPAAGIEFTVKGYDPNTNVIQAVKVKPQAANMEVEAVSQSKTETAGDLDSPYSMESIEKLFKDARNVEKLLGERMQKKDSVIGQ